MMQSSSSSEDDLNGVDESGINRREVFSDEVRGNYENFYCVGTGGKTEPDGATEDSLSRGSYSQFHEDNSSLISSNFWKSKQDTPFSKLAQNDKLSFTIRQDLQQPLVVRTSSLINRRSNSRETVLHSDETKSLFPVTANQLQTPLIGLDENSSLRSAWSSGHPSSADLSSLHSCSAISVPVVFDRNRSVRRARAVTMLGYSPSNFVQTDSSSRFSNSLSRIDQAQTIRDMQLSPVPPPRIVSPDVVEEVHKLHLQMYVFVLRCIAYPFTVGLPQDPVRRYLRLTKEYFNILKDRFTAFLNKDLQITCDEAFYNAVEHFYEIFLKSENVERMVKTGAFSMHDIREVFISSIEQRLVRFSEIDGLPKQTVISAWKIKFDQICRGGEGPCPIANRLGSQQLELTNPTREQLYEIFMRILSIKKYEHQILFNACQLDSVDEQAAQVRRELASQKSFLEEMAINRQYPKMVHKEMEVQYVEEQLNHVNQLMLQLDSVPVGKSHTYTSPSSAVGVVVQLQRRLQKKCSTTGHAGNSSLQPDRNGAPEDPKTVAGTAVKNAQRQAATFNPMAARPSLIGGGWTDDSGLDSGQQISVHHSGSVSKLSIQLSFHLEVSICQLRPLRHLSGNKQLFCTIELDGSSERQRTASVKACKPIWDTIAEFETSHPLPCLKIKLMKESNGPLSLDDKELGRVVLLPNPSTSRCPSWYKLVPTKHCADVLELQIAIRQERPSNLKYCGYCWVHGRTIFKKWKLRYLCLIQVSQYTFIMAAFKEARSTAYESMILEGYTVDYCETNQELVAAAKAELATETGGLLSASLPTLNKFRMSGTAKTPRRAEICGLSGASSVYRLPRYFFNVVKEGDALIFAVPDEAELHGWVQVIHRATGQSHKPVPPVRVSSSRCHFRKDERVRAHHLGLNQLASVKPHEVDHLPLIRELVSRMLDFRLKDPFVSLGWLSPAQNLIFDEYCNRYGIRTCQRHLVLLHELIRYGEEDITIDMQLLHRSYVICAEHVHGKAQGSGGINTVLSAEMEDFQAIRARLLAFLEKRLTGFRYYFPFNRPEAALENLLILMERVIDQSSDEMAGSEAVHSVVRICLRNAAVLNYEQISDFARREAKKDHDPDDVSLPTPEERLMDLIRLSEICIDALQQNEEYYSKAFIWFGNLFVEHTENFLSLLQMDMVEVLDNLPPDTWGIFQLFQLLNGFLVNSDSLANGQFHTALLNRFEPTVENYLNLMETSITQALVAGIEKEKWAPYSGGTSATDHNDITPCPSVNSQPHFDTDSVSHASLNVSKVPPASVSSSPGLLPSAVDDSDLFARQRTFNVIGPTSAFLDVLSRSRPLAFVGRAMRPTAIATSVANSGLSVAGSLQPSINIEGETELPSDLVCSLQCSRCCRTISILICRLHALNEFIRDLAWPDRAKATSWAERTRTVCSQLLRESAKRTLIELESTLRNASRSTDFILPSECFTMINSITAIRMQLFSLCNRHEAEVSPDSKQNESVDNQSPTELSMSQPTSVRMYTETEAFLEGVHRQMSVILTDHLLSVLSTVLNRLTRYDEGTILSSILTLAKSDNEDGKNYIHFIEVNLQILCHNLIDDVYLLSIFERWYVGQLRQVDDWLAQRQESVLTAYQIKYLSAIVRKVFLDFELQGVATHVLDNVAYKNVCHRLQVEETTLSVSSSLSSRQASRAPSQSSTPDTRRKWMKVIEGGISSIAQGTGLRPRQS